MYACVFAVELWAMSPYRWKWRAVAEADGGYEEKAEDILCLLSKPTSCMYNPSKGTGTSQLISSFRHQKPVTLYYENSPKADSDKRAGWRKSQIKLKY